MSNKIILLTNIPTPYRVPLYNAVNKIFFKNNYNFKVVFCAQEYDRRKWQNPLKDAKFDYVILKSWQIRLTEEWYLFLPINLFVTLLREKPFIVITGGYSIATIFVFLFHLMTNVPYIIWSGEIKRKTKKPYEDCVFGEL